MARGTMEGKSDNPTAKVRREPLPFENGDAMGRTSVRCDLPYEGESNGSVTTKKIGSPCSMCGCGEPINSFVIRLEGRYRQKQYHNK